jgi:pimeloyl-ACP methyl ester carboxylesterase
MTGSFAVLGDGVRLHYQVQGPPGAPWLVLFNGLLSDTTMWAGSLPGLTSRFRVLTLDGRGQGRSDAPAEGPYTPDLLARDAWELMERLGIRQPFLAGLSNGSSVALELLAAHPDAFRGAALVSAAPRIDFAMGLRLAHWLQCLELGGPALQFDAAAPFLWGDRFLEQRHAVLKSYFMNRKRGDEPFHSFRHQINGVLQWDIRPKLTAVRAPLLLLAGAEDLLTPPWKCLETAQLVQHSRFEVVPAVGHAYPVEDPRGFARRICDFLII